MKLRVIAASIQMAVVPVVASAVPITYTFATTGGTGSLGAATFSNANVTFTGTADTANIKDFFEVPTVGSHGMTFYANDSVVPLSNLTVRVAGLPVATFLSAVAVRYDYAGGLYFSDSSSQGYAGYGVPTAPSTPDVLSSFTKAPLGNVIPFMGTAATTAGTFSLEYLEASSLVAGTFSAAPAASVPEPGAMLLFSVGLLGWRLVAGGPRLSREQSDGKLERQIHL